MIVRKSNNGGEAVIKAMTKKFEEYCEYALSHSDEFYLGKAAAYCELLDTKDAVNKYSLTVEAFEVKDER